MKQAEKSANESRSAGMSSQQMEADAARDEDERRNRSESLRKQRAAVSSLVLYYVYCMYLAGVHVGILNYAVSLCISINQEAASLVKQRENNPREMFKQRERAFSQEEKAPPPPAPK